MSEVQPKKNGGKFQKKNTAVEGAAAQPPVVDTNVPPVGDQPPVDNQPPTPPVEEKEVGGKITSEAAAMKHFKKNYKLPQGQLVAHVAEDGNVFFNENNAYAHTRPNKLKLFTIKP